MQSFPEQFGERNVQLADILIGRSALENDAGDHAAAIAALDAAERALGEKDVATLAQLLASRGRTWMDLKDGKRAEPDLRAALKLRREGGGLRTGLAWFSQAELGKALALQGRFDEAQALLGEAERELQSLLGPDAYQNALIKLRRGTAYELQHEWRSAAEAYREAIDRAKSMAEHSCNSWNAALAQMLSLFPTVARISAMSPLVSSGAHRRHCDGLCRFGCTLRLHAGTRRVRRVLQPAVVQSRMISYAHRRSAEGRPAHRDG